MSEHKEKQKENTEMSLNQRIQNWSGIVMLVVTLGNILVGLVNFNIASKLTPLESRITANASEIDRNTERVEYNTIAITALHDDIDKRLVRIEDKVDTLLQR